MKTELQGCFLVLGLGLLAGISQAQEESISETYVTSVALIQGKGTNNSKFSFFSLQMVRPIVDAGTVTALGAGTLTDANALWTSGQFEGTNGAHYVDFASGVMADIVGTAGPGKTLTLGSDLQGLVSVGQGYQIRKHSTAASVFGEANQAGLLAGGNASVADDILIYQPQSQQTLTIFYSNVTNFTGWKRGFNDAKNQLIRPEQGLMIRRRASGDVEVSITGAVKENPTRIAIYPSYNLLGTLKTVQSVPLSGLGLYTGNTNTGIMAGPNASLADNLMALNPDGSTVTYYYSSVFNPRGWFRGFTRSDTNLISPGSTFFIRRRMTNGFPWTIPAESN